MRTRPTLALAALCLATAAPAQARVATIPSDVNGDGLADVLVGNPVQGDDEYDRVSIIFGSSDRSAVRGYYDDPRPRGFGITFDGSGPAKIVGDVNGDGLADVAVDGDDGLAIVYGGTATDPVEVAKLGSRGMLTKLEVDPLAPVGDVNGDGLGDLISDPLNSNTHFTRVHLGAKGAPFARYFEIVAGGRMRTNFARVFAIPAGDMNGDGIGDLAFPAADPTGRHSGGGDTEDLVYVVYGSRSRTPVVIGQKRRGGPITIRRGTIPGGRVIRHDRKTCRCTVFAVQAVGDIGGDRRDDLGIVLKQFGDDDDVRITPGDLEGDARLDIAFGSRSSRPVSVPNSGGATVTKTTWVDRAFALSDVTGDGRDDLLVAGKSGEDYRLLTGRGALPRRSPTAKLKVILRDAEEVDPAYTAGDVDGDGHVDAVYSVPKLQGNQPWGVLFGGSSLAPFSVTAPGAQIMAITPHA